MFCSHGGDPVKETVSVDLWEHCPTCHGGNDQECDCHCHQTRDRVYFWCPESDCVASKEFFKREPAAHKQLLDLANSFCLAQTHLISHASHVCIRCEHTLEFLNYNRKANYTFTGEGPRFVTFPMDITNDQFHDFVEFYYKPFLAKRLNTSLKDGHIMPGLEKYDLIAIPNKPESPLDALALEYKRRSS